MPSDMHVIVEAPEGFAISFEQASAALDTLDRLFLEPDGSFVWAGETAADPPLVDPPNAAPPRRWQLDGELYDRDGRLAYVIVKGNAPTEVLEQLIAAIGAPPIRLTFQLVREGQTLDESQFRAWLARNAGTE
jgi:hypothetical protein